MLIVIALLYSCETNTLSKKTEKQHVQSETYKSNRKANSRIPKNNSRNAQKNSSSSSNDKSNQSNINDNINSETMLNTNPEGPIALFEHYRSDFEKEIANAYKQLPKTTGQQVEVALNFQQSNNPISSDALEKAKTMYKKLSNAQRLAQLIIIRIDTINTEPTLQYANIIKKLEPGGILLFGKNIDNDVQLQQLINNLQSKSKVPLFISADIEGGKVNRFRKSSNKLLAKIPSAHDLSNMYNARQVEEIFYIVGYQLKLLGINMNFAPVVDILYPNTPKFLEERIFGYTSAETLQYSLSVMRGLQSSGIMAVAKHFPGHGSAIGDSHIQNAIVKNNFETIYNNDLVPYRALIENGISAIMLGHMLVPAIDKNNIASASIPTINLLTKNLGFNGLILTDSLKMEAFSLSINANQNSILSLSPETKIINSGVNIILDPSSPLESLSAMVQDLQNGTLHESKLKESVIKVLALKIQYLGL